MTTVPYWLQLLLGVFSLLFPELAWLKIVIEVAYEIWLVIPWFHKAGALVELRSAVKKAKQLKATKPVEDFSARWKAHNQALGRYPG
jgi:hypothetical protein